MKTKALVSAIAILGLMSGAFNSLRSEPGSHDHQATKTHVPSSSSTNKNPKATCIAKGDTDASNSIEDANTSNPESKKCKPEKETERRHDHRKMKNL